MKIIDTTTFYNENLMMDVRFNILNNYVDYFVVCEAKYSHSGKKKELNFKINNFSEFKKKIIYLIVENEPSNLINGNEDIATMRMNSIKRVSHQRDYIKNCLTNFSNDDLILYSDNDEIPKLDQSLIDDKTDLILFKQKIYYYKFNLILPNIDWFGTKGCRVKSFKDTTWLRNIKNKKYSSLRLDTIFSKLKYQNIKIISNGGWHFSNLKLVTDLHDKYLNDENHAVFGKMMNIDEIEKNVKNWEIGIDHTQDKKSSKLFTKVKLQKDELSKLPSYIVNNQIKFKDWIIK